MTRKLYIHVGPVKTGTSAIQSVLSKHDGSRILYPKVGQFGPHKSHHGLINGFTARSTNLPDSSADQLFRQFAANVRNAKSNVLISSEWIIMKKRGRFAPEFVRYLLSLLAEDSWDVEILFGCRDHFERAASLYSQVIKGARSDERRDPDEFLTSKVQRFLYSHMTRKIREAGFRLTGLNYHPSSGWMERFLTHVGFAENEVPKPKIKNSSLSTKALVAQLAACRVLREREERRIFWDALRQMPGFFAPAQFIFGPSAAAEAERSFAADRKFLRDEFGVALPEPDLEQRESRFFLNPGELADLSAAAQPLGHSADALINSAAAYLRT